MELLAFLICISGLRIRFVFTLALGGLLRSLSVCPYLVSSPLLNSVDISSPLAVPDRSPAPASCLLTLPVPPKSLARSASGSASWIWSFVIPSLSAASIAASK